MALRRCLGTSTLQVSFSAHAIPKINNTYDLGSTSLRWKKLWLVNGDVSGQVKAPSASSPTDGDYLVNKDYVDSEIGKLSGYWTKSGSNLSPTSANTHLVKNGTANLGTTASRWDNAYTVGTNTNTLVVNTSVNSSLVPNGSGTIGTSGTRWSHIYGTTITANTWSGGTVTGNFVPNSNNSRSLGNDSNRWASLYSVNVTTTNLSGCTVTGHVVPNSNNSKNLGSSGARWNNIYGNVLDFTVATGFELRGDITVDGNNSRNLGTSSNRLANVYAVTTNTQNLSVVLSKETLFQTETILAILARRPIAGKISTLMTSTSPMSVATGRSLRKRSTCRSRTTRTAKCTNLFFKRSKAEGKIVKSTGRSKNDVYRSA